MQQLTCNIDLSCSFHYLFFSFVLLELKPFIFEGESPGEKLWKTHEDGNGEKLTVKKWWLFGCRFFHGLRRVFHGL